MNKKNVMIIIGKILFALSVIYTVYKFIYLVKRSYFNLWGLIFTTALMILMVVVAVLVWF